MPLPVLFAAAILGGFALTFWASTRPPSNWRDLEQRRIRHREQAERERLGPAWKALFGRGR